MRISILPKSVLGWLSVGLAVASIVFMELSEPMISPGEAGANYSKALGTALILVLGAIGGAASITGLISIIKRKQGAILVFISTAIGLLFLVVGIGGPLGF